MTCSPVEPLCPLVAKRHEHKASGHGGGRQPSMFDHTPAVESRSRHIDMQRDNGAADSRHDRAAGSLGGVSTGSLSGEGLPFVLVHCKIYHVRRSREGVFDAMANHAPSRRAQQSERIG